MILHNPNHMSRHDFENDCKEIHDSGRQFDRSIPVLATQTPIQRRQIRESYKAMYEDDLITKNETGSRHDFENDCKEIHYSGGQFYRSIRVLAKRTPIERRKIRETYEEMYGDDLISSVVQKTGRNEAGAGVSSEVSEALLLWMLESHERDAAVAREALEQGETNYGALVEIFVGRKSSHIVLVKQAYQARFKRWLDQDIINIEPPHPYQRILVALATSHKAHHADVSQHVGKCDARRLFETGEGSSGCIQESVVLEILSKRSIPQLKLTFSCYKHIYGHDYTKSLKMGNPGEFEDALKKVVKCLLHPSYYYAKIMYTSIKGTTADKGALARAMVSRADVDMNEIQRVFKKKFKMELRDSICERIASGDYRDFLVALATQKKNSNYVSTTNAMIS